VEKSTGARVSKATVPNTNVESAIRQAAASGERMAGWIRIVISVLVLVQYLVFNGLEDLLDGQVRPLIVVSTLLGVLLVSAVMLWKLDPRSVSDRFLWISVGVDALVCLMVVVPTAIWPDHRYDGLMNLPNMAFFVLAVFLSGFRLNPRLSAFSLVLNGLGMALVLRIDASNGILWGPHGGQELVVLSILMLSGGLLAVAVATRSRDLAHGAGVAAVEKDRARSQLGVYVPEEVVDLALEKGALGLIGEKRELAVLFVDLRGFTRMCANKDAAEVVEDLNAWLNEIVQVVQQERGTVDKYIGDCVMAVFGMVATEGEEAACALRTAAGIVDRMATFNAERVGKGLPEMGYGVGVHFGQGIVGSMGGAGRLQYTVIGDVVNRASRLEALTKEADVKVFLSKELVDRARAEVPTGLPDVEVHTAVQLRGIDQPVEVFCLG
jgi:class 3 adenylate cyclase